jgi:YVTN family beta-propeller protein
MAIDLTPIGTYTSGVFDEGAAEIVAYDPVTQRLFVVNGDTASIDVIDVSDPSNPTFNFAISPAGIGGINSVAVKNGIVAIAAEAPTVTDDGQVFFYSTAGVLLNAVTAGALPDMVTFTPDGTKVLVANEGEPDGGIDPEGSVSIIDISGGVVGATVQTADFTSFNGTEQALRDAGVRIFPGKSVSEDLEPEYIAVSPDGTKAFVTLQEANSVAIVDIATASVEEIVPLGVKDHSLPGNGLDPSDRDDAIAIDTYPIFGMYMPDAIASFEIGGNTYYATANEGDDRGEDERIGDLTLDPVAFPNAAALQENEVLGRLGVSTIDGDIGNDGDYDQLFAYGSRSFSIWDDEGNLVFDSGDDFERIIATVNPNFFNVSNDDNDPEARSDAKGPEPEAVEIGVIDGKTYAFIGLERDSGIMIYDVSDPLAPQFVRYLNNRDYDADQESSEAGDQGPEGLKFISAADSPNGKPLLAVANEVSGTTTLYEIDLDAKPVKLGDEGRDYLRGSRKDDDLLGFEGNDKLDGKRGDDFLGGGLGKDKLNGGKGDDELQGGPGRDYLDGGRGNDLVDGGTEDDHMRGGRGDDIMIGRQGNDTMWGDKGDDIFIFNPGDGLDTVKDFKPGQDKIDLSAFEDIDSFDDIVIEQQGGGGWWWWRHASTKIILDDDVDDPQEILLVGVKAGHLDADDFILGA